MGQVRAILLKHAGVIAPETVVAVPGGAEPRGGRRDAYRGDTDLDPNGLVPDDALAFALQDLEAREGPQAVRRLGVAYMALWARTFRTLVSHLRARPERALNLFAQELYPFLRGDRLAARLEPRDRRRARLVLAPGLPDSYLCGLVEGAVALSGCQATCVPLGHGIFEVHYRIPPAMWVARSVQAASTMRVPLLVAALLAGLVGAAAAVTHGAALSWRIPAALLAVTAVQGAANAFHDLASPAAAGPLSPWRPGRPWLWAQMLCGYGFAAAVGGMLVVETPLILALVPVGLAASLLYHRVRDHGLGPVFVAFTHGPLIALGVLLCIQSHPSPSTLLVTSLASLPVGALAAAVRTLEDLADRPLDEAGGKRTLAVRLPGAHNAVLFAALVLAGPLCLLGLAAFTGGLTDQAPADLAAWLLVLTLAVAAAFVAYQVRHNLENPRGLAAARVWTIALHIGAAAASLALMGAAA